jgi:hypothetical protein
MSRKYSEETKINDDKDDADDRKESLSIKDNKIQRQWDQHRLNFVPIKYQE